MTSETYNKKIARVLITKEEIDEKIKYAGKKIDEIYDGNPILLVSILKGAFVFMADLCRAVSVPCEIGFMCAKSYHSSTVSSGVVQITMDLEQDISKYHVVIVEDIEHNKVVKVKTTELLPYPYKRNRDDLFYNNCYLKITICSRLKKTNTNYNYLYNLYISAGHT